MQSLSLFSLFAAGSLATKLLLPLYQYPLSTTWDPIFSAIEANPQVEFQIILNVDDGPGGAEPDSDFVTGTSKLNSYSNVVTLGYVHCLDGEAPEDEVNTNTTNWAAWNSYTEANVSIDGIFFDETPNTASGSNDVSFMTAVVQSAISAFGSHEFTSIFNPGAAVEHDEFWSIADIIVIFEDEAEAYSSSVLTTNIPSGRANQSAILIPDFADVASASTSMAETWIQEMIAAGLASGHILNYDYIQATSTEEPAPIGSVAAALGVSSTGSTPASSSSSVDASSVVASSTSSSLADTATSAVATTSVSAASEATSTVEASTASVPEETATPTAEPTTSKSHKHHHWNRIPDVGF